MEEKYIALRKSDTLIIFILFLLPLVINFLTGFFQNGDVYYQIKHYVGEKIVIDDIEPQKQSSFIINSEKGSLLLEFDKEKGVRVASSTCPCKICVNSGWTKSEALVCVPNSVIVQPIVRNQKSSAKSVDGVTR